MTLEQFMASENIRAETLWIGNFKFYAKKPMVFQGERIPNVDFLIPQADGDITEFLKQTKHYTIMFRNLQNRAYRHPLLAAGYRFHGPACNRTFVRQADQQ